MDFREKYGPWALVAGASEGIGAAFAVDLAARGLNLVLVARRPDPLQQLAHRLPTETLCIPADLAHAAALETIASTLADRDIGLLVYNAALSVIGPFLEQPLEAHVREIDVNVKAPLRLVHYFAKPMVQRRKGGIILMSSIAGLQGGPYIANYAATKAFNLIFAEGLWTELSQHGVDVLACVAGATATDRYSESAPQPTSRFAPPPLSPQQVAREALDALGKRPSHVPGRANRMATQLMRRLLPRKTILRLMEQNTRGLIWSKPS